MDPINFELDFKISFFAKRFLNNFPLAFDSKPNSHPQKNQFASLTITEIEIKNNRRWVKFRVSTFKKSTATHYFIVRL